MPKKNNSLPIIALLITFMCCHELKAQVYQVKDSMAIELKLTHTFSKILVTDGITLVYNQSEDEGLAISASSAIYLQNLEVMVVGDTLKLGLSQYLPIKDKRAEYKVYAASSICNYISLSNAARLIILGDLFTDSLEVVASNAAKINAALSVNKLSLSLSSASLAQLAGKANQATIQVKDASTLNGSLATDTALLSISGASKIWLRVSKSLNLIAGGASKIYLTGKPDTVVKRLTGLSRLKIKD